jgi:hypothetical protein
LRAVAVDALGRDPLARQRLGEPVRPMLGPREHEHARQLGALEQCDQQRGLELGRHRVDGVRDADGGGGGALDVTSMSRDRATTGGGIVAEKNSVCRCRGR